jgi:plastocyanin
MRREKDSIFKAVASILAIAGLAVVILASLLVSVGPTVRAADQWVTVADYSFTPSAITINIGDSVTWMNNGSIVHTATSTSAPSGGAFDSGTLAAGGGMYTHQFLIAGSYSYHCTFHPTLMSGTITVNTTIPEFSSFTFVVVGLLVMMLGLTFARRRL